MTLVEEMAQSISPPLCRPLAELCDRLHSVSTQLAPALYTTLRAQITDEIDICLYEVSSKIITE